VTAPGTAVQVRDALLAEMTERYGEQITALAPAGSTPAHYAASLRLYLAQNDKVLKCSSKSVMVGMLRVAQTGLELGVSCDLLPFGETCQFSPRYNGIIELALGAGTRAINADVVREGDEFDMEKGTRPHLRHRRASKGDAKILGAYAVAEIRVNSFVFEYLTRDEIDAIRQKYSKQWKGGELEAIPWYARKTAVRRLSAYLPKNARLAAALLFADEKAAAAEDIPEGEAEVIDVDTETGEIQPGADAPADEVEA
jgi:phage RecT family recombinase